MKQPGEMRLLPSSQGEMGSSGGCSLTEPPAGLLAPSPGPGHCLGAAQRLGVEKVVSLCQNITVVISEQTIQIWFSEFSCNVGSVLKAEL